MKPEVNVPLAPPGFTTTTSLAPSVPAGVTAVIDALDTTLTPVAAAPPIVTVAPVPKLDPTIVIGVPPEAVPEEGVTEVTIGDTPTTNR